MSHKRFFPVNMKFPCLFSWSVGISLESWHIEQGINSDGAFRIFSHANRFKKIVATLASQVHCVTNVVQHAVCFCAGTRGREGTEGELGTICRGLEKIAWPACDSLFTCPACDSQITCRACDSQFTCRACDSQFTCRACIGRFICPARDVNNSRPIHAAARPREGFRYSLIDYSNKKSNLLNEWISLFVF